MSILLVLLAFGFVIFWHELGHFLAARWAGVRVEQFAVGMGQALISWRKGIGVRVAGFGRKGFHWGSTQEAFDKRIDEEHARSGNGRPASALSTYERYEIARKLGIGETEYRLAWVPLGGYVKPTGQDDLRPAAEVGADDPHAFGAKPVGKRMVIISAGVIMNVILAFGVYVLLFLTGFNSPPAVVGFVSPGSPAMEAGLQVGDRIKTINGNVQEDYTKIAMNVALLRDDGPAEFVVERPGMSEPVTLQIKPIRTAASFNMPAIGVMPGVTLKSGVGVTKDQMRFVSPELAALPQGAVITHINGQAVEVNDYHKLDAAIQAYDGTPIKLTIQHPDQSTVEHTLVPDIGFNGFAAEPLSVAGLRPRVRIESVVADSPAQKAGVEPGDVVAQLSIVETADALRPVNAGDFVEWIGRASKARHSVRLSLIRDGNPIPAIDIKPEGTIGVGVGYESQRAIVGEVVDRSTADSAGIRTGDRLVSVGGTPVETWFDAIRQLRNATVGSVPVTIARGEQTLEIALPLDKYDLAELADLRFGHSLPLAQLIEPRQTSNPILAGKWGIEETKQSIFQVYLTLQRLIQGTVPLKNLSGPIGILSAGSSAADRGIDYLLWFTAMISANLAVVNFLPIPIVDGGLFLFLLLEKFTGRPPSPRLQNAAQLFGLALLGSLFLFVTYHDVLRIFG
jgi:regulator of sigma E protease